jgi:hypothetical protein
MTNSNLPFGTERENLPLSSVRVPMLVLAQKTREKEIGFLSS